MKKLLFVAVLLVVGIGLTLVLRRPPPLPPSFATVPVVRKSAHELEPTKHVRHVSGPFAGHHHPKK